MIPFRDLFNAHADQPALVMGGGPSLPGQLVSMSERGHDEALKIPRDFVRIGVNQHAGKIVDCDYHVGLDARIISEMRENSGLIIMPHDLPGVDVRLTEFWHAGFSGMLGVWCAHQMGCHPIVLAGMDCYSSGTYFHDPDAESSGNHSNPEDHVSVWERQMQRNCMHASIRSMGAPLDRIFGRYDPTEVIERIEPITPMVPEDITGVVVEFIRPTRVKGQTYDVGSVTELSKDLAREMISIEKAREWTGDPLIQWRR